VVPTISQPMDEKSHNHFILCASFGEPAQQHRSHDQDVDNQSKSPVNEHESQPGGFNLL